MALERTPEHRLVDIAEVGRVVAFLVGGGASGMTGDVIYVDQGQGADTATGQGFGTP